MKVLIHEDRTEGMDFLLGMMIKRGYKARWAKTGPEIMDMLSDDEVNIVLTNGSYEELNGDQHERIKASCVFMIDIAQHFDRTTTVMADMQLQKPFAISELWRALDANAKRN